MKNTIDDIQSRYVLDLPLLNLFFLKKRIQISCYIRDILCNLYFNKDFKKTRLLKNTKSGPALIMAHGPRLKECINYAKNNLKKALEGEVFCINQYILHKDLIGIEPDYYCLFDFIYYEDVNNQETVDKAFRYGHEPSKKIISDNLQACPKVWDLLKNKKNLKIFGPVKHAHKLKDYNFYPVRNTFSIAVKNSKDITKTLCWLPISAYGAISIALYMGFDDIYLAGFDTDSFKSIEYDHKNSCVKYVYKHFYSEENVVKRLSDTDLTNYFLGLSSILRSHKNINFTNLDQSGIFS